MTANLTANRLDDQRLRQTDRASEAPATTATGHRVGRRYFSLSHRARYDVVRVATAWELAPGQCVRVRWENGNSTTSDRPRGRDPEVCRSCDRPVEAPARLAIGRCHCRPATG